MEDTDLSWRSWIMGAQLRRCREQAGLTARAVADTYLKCSASRIYSIEAGTRRISNLELEGLVCRVYGRPDLLGRLETLRKQIEDKVSDAPVSDTLQLSPNVMMFHDLQCHAVRSTEMSVGVLPGILQSVDYSIAQQTAFGRDSAQAVEYSRAKSEHRRRVLEAQPKPEIIAIVTEGALRRATYVEGQIEHLDDLIVGGEITVLVLPDKAGPIPVSSTFAVLNLKDLPDILYTETVVGGWLSEKAAEAKEATEVWTRLSDMALSPTQSLAMIRGLDG